MNLCALMTGALLARLSAPVPPPSGKQGAAAAARASRRTGCRQETDRDGHRLNIAEGLPWPRHKYLGPGRSRPPLTERRINVQHFIGDEHFGAVNFFNVVAAGNVNTIVASAVDKVSIPAGSSSPS